MSLGIDDFLREQVASIKAKIVAYNAALTDLESGMIQSYELDSGQSRQKVTLATKSTLEARIESLMNQLTTLEARLCGTGVVRVIPSF